jgi:adenosylcobinamide-phosphate synthase
LDRLYILAGAVALDAALGEPPNLIHPVAWMGKIIGLSERGGKKLRPTGQFIYGMLMTIFITGLFAVSSYYLISYLTDLNQAAYIIVTAILLKLSFSIRGLCSTALKIRRLLREGKLDRTRREMRALVSRDTVNLDERQLASGAVESVAEGMCDSVAAPLFYFLLLGVPGAIAYRAVNTLDSMIGYRGEYEYLGKFAARLDDVLNFIPARLAALMITAAAVFMKGYRRAWRTALSEHGKTESPNAGWPMAAMAGALGVRLEKAGHYVLGEGNTALARESIGDAIKLFALAAASWIIVCFIGEGIRIAVTT